MALSEKFLLSHMLRKFGKSLRGVELDDFELRSDTARISLLDDVCAFSAQRRKMN